MDLFDRMSTDMGNARRFALQHAGRTLYTHSHKWLVWDGKRWKMDEMAAVERMARLTVRSLWDERDALNAQQRQVAEAAGENVDDATKTRIAEMQKESGRSTAWALKSQARRAVDNMLALAASEPEIRAHATDFDVAPWLLNVRNGTLDLQTGELYPHDPTDRLTKLTDIDYDPAAQCPLWLVFLEWALPDAEVRVFMQRFVGYSLTGDVSEQFFTFLFGGGNNGKSVFSETVMRLLGEYCVKMSHETITDKKRRAGGATEDIARLQGKRLFVVNEWPDNVALNEEMVKDMTGEDTLTARFLYKGSFDFHSEGKLLVYGCVCQSEIASIDHEKTRQLNRLIERKIIRNRVAGSSEMVSSATELVVSAPQMRVVGRHVQAAD